MSASKKRPPLELAFDIGHSSIGWAVLEGAGPTTPPSLLATGTVIFEKDSALANTRRLHRQQRRHVRATRLRIARMEKLLVHLDIFSAEELSARHRAGAGHPTPWLLAARVLASDGTRTLTWPELWEVLRWYAHNRGYEEIGRESGDDEVDADEQKKDADKIAHAKAALAQFGTTTMAETICAWLGQDPLGERSGTVDNYKTKDSAFERDLVVAEVVRLLAAHRGKLRGVDEALIAALLLDARAIAVPTIRLPRRYQGSLLFGRLATRYHNRIIGRCPISGDKLPNKNCPEFLRYRWAMQLANIRVAESAANALRPLTPVERAALHSQMLAQGYLDVRDLKEAVGHLPGITRHNLEALLLHPDAKEGLVFDPVQKLITSDARVRAVWPHLPLRLHARVRGRWRRGQATTLAALRAEAATLGHELAEFDAAVDVLCTPPPAKTKRKTPPPTRDALLSASLDTRRELAKLSGRAPYARPLLEQAFAEVLAGKDPKARGGSLEETEVVRRRREQRPLPQQTNNHLVRHRLQIFARLLDDLIADPAYGDATPARIARITLEVNRDLREMAGLSAQDIAKEIGLRLRQHKDAVAWLEQDPQVAPKINAGLIRKARVVLDLGKKCPYTGVDLNPIDLVTKRVDLDHIIPRSQRATDSLDALAVTFSAINKWKGARTAWQFISDEGGKPVPDVPQLSLMTPAKFKAFVEGLDTKGHLDDYRRKKRRKEWLLLPHYEEKSRTFTPGQLTQTSQLARLAAQVVHAPFAHLPQSPQLVALPGTVTGSVRKAWNLLGCLATATPAVMEAVKLPDGSEKKVVRTKTEIRDLTHLHHALDACVLAFAAHFIPNRGDVWAILAERKLNAAQQAELRALDLIEPGTNGQFQLRDLAEPIKEQIRHRLAERRVVQHVPADMSGLRVEENTRGILRRENGRVFLRQRKKGADGRVATNHTDEPEGKVIGLPNPGTTGGKLAALHGVRVITSNFGVAVIENPALAHAERFFVIPHERVHQRIAAVRVQAAGKKVQIWRNGQVIELLRGSHAGQWRIFSIMDSARGIIVKMDRVDAPSFADTKGATGIKLMLPSLLASGARRLKTSLIGQPL